MLVEVKKWEAVWYEEIEPLYIGTNDMFQNGDMLLL